MKRYWTRDEAVLWLEKTSDVGIIGKDICINKNRLSGLTACAALSFLLNHCGYHAMYTRN